LELPAGVRVVYVGTKVDLRGNVEIEECANVQMKDVLEISAETGLGLEGLKARMVATVGELGSGALDTAVISNVRHLTALERAGAALAEAAEGIELEATPELVALDIRHAIPYLGEITGEITTDEVLGNIFSKFCIGK